MRYNQFVRMLQRRGGWEVAPLPRLRYASSTPWRWAQRLLEGVQNRVQLLSWRIADAVAAQAGKVGFHGVAAPPALLRNFLAALDSAVETAQSKAVRWAEEAPALQAARALVAGRVDAWGLAPQVSLPPEAAVER
jgi:hypothetical protein